MVNAQPGVAAVGISEIIPEGVYPLVGMELSEGIRPTLRKKVAIGGADFRAEKRVIWPAAGFVDTEIQVFYMEAGGGRCRDGSSVESSRSRRFGSFK